MSKKTTARKHKVYELLCEALKTNKGAKGDLMNYLNVSRATRDKILSDPNYLIARYHDRLIEFFAPQGVKLIDDLYQAAEVINVKVRNSKIVK